MQPTTNRMNAEAASFIAEAGESEIRKEAESRFARKIIRTRLFTYSSSRRCRDVSACSSGQAFPSIFRSKTKIPHQQFIRPRCIGIRISSLREEMNNANGVAEDKNGRGQRLRGFFSAQRKAERKVAADKSMRDNRGIIAKRNERFAVWPL